MTSLGVERNENLPRDQNSEGCLGRDRIGIPVDLSLNAAGLRASLRQDSSSRRWLRLDTVSTILCGNAVSTGHIEVCRVQVYRERLLNYLEQLSRKTH
jgi:hypothetical protein